MGTAGESVADQTLKVAASADAGDGQHAGGTSVAGVGASGMPEEVEPIASVSVPSGKVEVDEDSQSQTLGGMLPMVLGVNEDGRFDFDQYLLRPEVKRLLDELTSKLKTAEYDRLDVTGYADRMGTVDHNQRLSELRAWSVARYLIAAGVPENKIRYEGRGQQHPLTRPGDCTGLSRDALIVCLQKDRRVEIEASIHRKHATIVQ